MKRYQTLAVACMLAAGSNFALADSMSLTPMTRGAMPVLVHVDSQGKVTDVSSSSRLSPRFERLLRQNLDEMITKPATVHGHPVDTQFVVNLTLQTTQREDGQYSAHFAYVSSMPVPTGSWYWVHLDGNRLALADRNDRQRMRHPDIRFVPMPYQPTLPGDQPAPEPPTQTASHGAPRMTAHRRGG